MHALEKQAMNSKTWRLGAVSMAGVVAWTLAGCALEQGSAFDAVARLASPYSAPVRQGNWVDEDAVRKLQRGMSQEQVRLLLGTPLLVDPFRPHRWDYFYYFDDKKGRREQRRLTLVFVDGRLDRVEGDVVPAQENSTEASRSFQVIAIPPKEGK